MSVNCSVFRVQSLHAQSIGLRLALQNLRRALYFRVLQVAAVRRGGFGIGEAAEAVHEIFGSNRVAVAPFRIAQVERPNTPFIRRLPFQRQRRNGFAFVIRTDQAVHHLTDNSARRHIRAFLRSSVLGSTALLMTILLYSLRLNSGAGLTSRLHADSANTTASDKADTE